jgi:hypothetical protein
MRIVNRQNARRRSASGMHRTRRERSGLRGWRTAGARFFVKRAYPGACEARFKKSGLPGDGPRAGARFGPDSATICR